MYKVRSPRFRINLRAAIAVAVSGYQQITSRSAVNVELGAAQPSKDELAKSPTHNREADPG